MAISKTQQFFEKLWYRDTVWCLWLFLPLHWLLKLLVWFRRNFYRWGLFKSSKPNVPVIIIGNINVGGTGKTPFAIFLLGWLQQQGFKPGLVTRGYGSELSAHPVKVTDNSKLFEVGDEPFLIHQHTRCPIIVDHQRARGAALLEQEHGCDLIVCDDGLQHYALQRDIEILIVDKERSFGNGWLMPFGPLRETIARGGNCHLKVVNGSDMRFKIAQARKVHNQEVVTKDAIQPPLTAVAAIGNPQRFFNTLSAQGFEFSSKVFPDHHKFIKADFTAIQGSIMMTEKDAVKCKDFAGENYFYLPIEAEITANITQQLTTLLAPLMTKSNS